MSHELKPIASDHKAATPRVPTTRSRVRVVLGIGLWASALVMAVVVWQAGRRLRESIQARAQASAIRALPDATDASHPSDGAVAGVVSKPSSAEPMWDPKGVGDFTFTERSGRKVTKADLLGHPWLISFIFTRCAGPCPKVSGRMSDLQRLLAGTDVKLVSLTVDPDFDKPDVLNRYAQMFGADRNRWLMLTGDKQKTYQLINESFKMPVKELTGPDREPGYEVLHSLNILRVNEKGVVVAKYNALSDADIARLEHDLAPYIDKAKAAKGVSQKSSAEGRASDAPKGPKP